MKYLFLFVLSFMLATPALAARQVPGSVPDVQPLQPIPANVGPSIEHNVQNEPESGASSGIQDQSSPDSVSASGSTTPAQGRPVGINWIMIGSFTLAVGVVFLAIRHRKE